MAAKEHKAPTVNIKNKRASFEYAFLDKFEAGIQLTGTEIKSIRALKASIVEGYCFLQDGEVFIRNMFIDVYENGSYANHEPRRERKLLLNKHEISKLQKALKNQGVTLIPLRLFLNPRGLAKLDIALAQGKKTVDKRQDLKAKDAKRDMDRAMKG